jgi:hypothetical protein
MMIIAAEKRNQTLIRDEPAGSQASDVEAVMYLEFVLHRSSATARQHGKDCVHYYHLLLYLQDQDSRLSSS